MHKFYNPNPFGARVDIAQSERCRRPWERRGSRSTAAWWWTASRWGTCRHSMRCGVPTSSGTVSPDTLFRRAARMATRSGSSARIIPGATIKNSIDQRAMMHLTINGLDTYIKKCKMNIFMRLPSTGRGFGVNPVIRFVALNARIC